MHPRIRPRGGSAPAAARSAGAHRPRTPRCAQLARARVGALPYKVDKVVDRAGPRRAAAGHVVVIVGEVGGDRAGSRHVDETADLVPQAARELASSGSAGSAAGVGRAARSRRGRRALFGEWLVELVCEKDAKLGQQVPCGEYRIGETQPLSERYAAHRRDVGGGAERAYGLAHLKQPAEEVLEELAVCHGQIDGSRCSGRGGRGASAGGRRVSGGRRRFGMPGERTIGLQLNTLRGELRRHVAQSATPEAVGRGRACEW